MKDMALALVHERRFWIAVAILGGALAVGTAGWLGYGAYTASRDRRAQLALVEQLDRLEAMRVNPDADAIAWEAIEIGLTRGYQEHASSSFGPFFLAFQAEIASHKGLHDQALEIMDKAVAAMPVNSVITALYILKRAVMRLDSDNPELHKQGRRELLDIGQNARNKTAGLAWYHLWEYAVVNRDEELRKLAHGKLQVYPVVAYKVRSLLEQAAEHEE